MDEQVKTFHRSVIFVQSVRRGAQSIPIGNIYESLQTLWLEAFLLEYAKLLSHFAGGGGEMRNHLMKTAKRAEIQTDQTSERSHWAWYGRTQIRPAPCLSWPGVRNPGYSYACTLQAWCRSPRHSCRRVITLLAVIT